MNTDTISGIISTAYPRPADTFAHAKWAGDLADICTTLSKQYRKEETALIRTIQNHNLTSEIYEVQELCRPYASVNIPLLKQQEPDVYQASVHIRHADAAAILGKAALYEQVKAKLGDAIEEYEVVTVTDVRKHLPASTAARYIMDGEEFVKFAVVRKDA